MEVMHHIFFEKGDTCAWMIRKQFRIKQIKHSGQVEFSNDIDIKILPVQSFLTSAHDILFDDFINEIVLIFAHHFPGFVMIFLQIVDHIGFHLAHFLGIDIQQVSVAKPNGPQGLRGQTKPKATMVELTYSFDDNSYQYVGNTPQKALDTLFSELGPEWIGVDGILENIVLHVVKDGLTPDTNGVINPEILEPLKDLVSIELSTTLIVDENEANMDAKGMMYEGEMGVNNRTKDSLRIKVVYNEKDTVIGIGQDHNITNLQLAALKMHAMRKKLEYELIQRYGDIWAVLWDGEEPTVDKTAAKKIVYLKTPRITPNNPNQPAYQVNSVKLRFTRGNTIVAAPVKPVKIRGKGHLKHRVPSGARIRDRVY